MTNVIPFKPKQKYDNIPERKLASIWEDIKGNNHANLCRNLLNSIAKNEDKVKTLDIPLFSKQMWNSETHSYEAFYVEGARSIINERQEALQMRIYMPLPNQSEVGDIMTGWQKYDCSYLQEFLKDKEISQQIRPNQKAAKNLQNWLVVIKQDQQAYKDEGRYGEISGYDDRVGY